MEKALAALTEKLTAEKDSPLAALQETLEQQSKEALEKALGSKSSEADAVISSLKEEGGPKGGISIARTLLTGIHILEKALFYTAISTLCRTAAEVPELV